MRNFEDILGNPLEVGDDIALFYDTLVVPGKVIAFTRARVRVKAIGKGKYWDGYTFLKQPSRLLKIKN